LTLDKNIKNFTKPVHDPFKVNTVVWCAVSKALIVRHTNSSNNSRINNTYYNGYFTYLLYNGYKNSTINILQVSMERKILQPQHVMACNGLDRNMK